MEWFIADGRRVVRSMVRITAWRSRVLPGGTLSITERMRRDGGVFENSIISM